MNRRCSLLCALLIALGFACAHFAFADDLGLDAPRRRGSLERTGASAAPLPAINSSEGLFSLASMITAAEQPFLQTASPTASQIDFLADLRKGTGYVFSRDNIPLALIGTGLSAIVYSDGTFDQDVKDYFQTRRPIGRISWYGDKLGLGYYHILIGSLLFGSGQLAHDTKLADTGIVVVEALLVNAIATEGLKLATDRCRPNSSNDFSFPSGHASSTATLAASISAMYDWDLRLAIPLYAVVFFVGASRIQDNDHYLSDVIAGTTLGTAIGSSFARYHRDKQDKIPYENRISFEPFFDKHLKGLLCTMTW